MRELFSLKAVFFSFAISLALFSCSNLQDGTQGAGGLVGQGQGAQSSSAAITRTIGGSLVMSGLFPRGFGSKPSAVSKTLFPEADSVDSSALDYFVTASHAGLSDISGTVTAGSGGVLTYFHLVITETTRLTLSPGILAIPAEKRMKSKKSKNVIFMTATLLPDTRCTT